MSQYVETATRAFPAGGAIAEHLRVKLSSGVLAAAGISDVGIGTMERASFAAADVVAVRLRTAQGTHKCVAAGAIAADAVVYTAAAGKVNDVSTGAIAYGTAMDAAAADGDVIEVLSFVQPLS